MKTVIITGGSGMIGKRLYTMLTEKEYEVIVFSHSKKNSTGTEPQQTTRYWNIDTGEIDTESIARADYIIHLAGAGVADKRWTSKRKEEIRQSRTGSSALLVKTLAENNNHIKTVVSASAIGWYGADNERSRQKGFTENLLSAPDFLGETCRLWEESIEPVTMLGKRLVKLRLGIVLSENGGALKEFIKPLKAGVASILGSGSQVISWIHIDDVCRMFIYAMENEHLQGIFNTVTPQTVTNKELVLMLAKQLRGTAFIAMHVPAFVLKIALGEMSVEVLKSATVSADKIYHSGFDFLYPNLAAALQEIVARLKKQITVFSNAF